MASNRSIPKNLAKNKGKKPRGGERGGGARLAGPRPAPKKNLRPAPAAAKTAAMAYSSFSDFVAALDEAGELRRIAVPVATELEITEVANREMKSPGGGKALLFEKPTIQGKTSSFPLAINTMGSHRRMAMALKLGAIEELAQQMQLILKAKPPTSMKSAWKLALQGLDLLHAKPKNAPTGPCKGALPRFDDKSPAKDPGALPTLLDLPILQCWPNDGGRFVTLPNVHTRDPDTGERNLGMYRMQIYDDRTTGM